MRRMLCFNPKERITAQQALTSQYFYDNPEPNNKFPFPKEVKKRKAEQASNLPSSHPAPTFLKKPKLSLTVKSKYSDNVKIPLPEIKSYASKSQGINPSQAH